MVQAGAPGLVPLARNIGSLASFAGVAQETIDDEVRVLWIGLPAVAPSSSFVRKLAPIGGLWLDPSIGDAALPSVSDLGPFDLREGTRQERRHRFAASPLEPGVELFQKLDVAVYARQ